MISTTHTGFTSRSTSLDGEDKMISIKALVLGALIVTGGFLAGSMIRGFVSFIMDAIEKENRRNDDN